MSVGARAGLCALAALVLLPLARAQTTDALWRDVDLAARPADARLTPATATVGRALHLDRAALAARLAAAPLETAPGRFDGAVEIPLPGPDGGLVWFRVVEVSVMAPALQARYPQIRTYLGEGRDVPGASARISLTPAGFAAMAFLPSGTIGVDPYGTDALGVADPDHYLAYYRRDALPTDAYLAARAEEIVETTGAGDAGQRPAFTGNGQTLRIYRLALAATGEYTAFHSARAGNPPNKADGLAAQVVAMNRVNGVYERDLAIRMQLVANNDTLVYIDPATDPYTNGGGTTLLAQNQANLDQIIGSANYDIGHVFETGGGGVAGLGVVCASGQKARGETGLSSPINDFFYIDYVAHEMGHQFRGNHTFNGSLGACAGGNRNGSTAVEPGSGSTIMAYAGICSTDNLQNRSDAYFHTTSLQEIVAFVTTGGGSTCGTTAPIQNDIPVPQVEAGFVLPVGTPFRLVGGARDTSSTQLTYNWEEVDLGPAGPPARNGIPAGPPFFRSFTPTADSVRYFPRLDRILAGLTPVVGEALPTDARTMILRFTARDNRAGGGAFGDTTVSVRIDVGAGPFAATFGNTPGTEILTASTFTVTWDVANTAVNGPDGMPDADFVDVENVEILFSDNGGTTFDYVLAASTPNDGSAEVTMPNIETLQGRFLIRAIGNAFFDVNDRNINLTMTVAAGERPGVDAPGLDAVRPNPVAGTAQVALRTADAGDVAVAVYDALGRRVAVVFQGTLPAGAEQTLRIDTTGLPAGVYVVRATGAALASAQRFTVVR